MYLPGMCCTRKRVATSSASSPKVPRKVVSVIHGWQSLLHKNVIQPSSEAQSWLVEAGQICISRLVDSFCVGCKAMHECVDYVTIREQDVMLDWSQKS